MRSLPTKAACEKTKYFGRKHDRVKLGLPKYMPIILSLRCRCNFKPQQIPFTYNHEKAIFTPDEIYKNFIEHIEEIKQVWLWPQNAPGRCG